MLPQSQILKENDPMQRPLLNEPVIYRVLFCKRNDAQYISHLDLQRTIMRVLSRAGIPMWYTEGFNPHPKVIFALPLSVGAESVCEFLDLKIARQISCEETKDLLNRQLTADMEVRDVYVPKTKFTEIGWADYTVRCVWPGLDTVGEEQIVSFLQTSPVLVTKKSKSGPKTFDIVPLIGRISLSREDKQLVFRLRLSASENDYLNPELLLGALREQFELGPEDPAAETHTIMRDEVYFKNGTVFR